MYETPFLGKLCELETDEQTMRQCLKSCSHLNQKEIGHQLALLREQYAQSMSKLDSFIQNGRSPAIVALAEAQKEYYQKIQQITEDALPHYLHSETSTQKEDIREARMLYAEYSIDFARTTILQALIAVLDGMEMQWAWKQEER